MSADVDIEADTLIVEKPLQNEIFTLLGPGPYLPRVPLPEINAPLDDLLQWRWNEGLQTNHSQIPWVDLIEVGKSSRESVGIKPWSAWRELPRFIDAQYQAV